MRGQGRGFSPINGLNRLIEEVYPRLQGASSDTGVKYWYGPPKAPNGNAGRLIKVEDESGTSEYGYGLLGETVWERREILTIDPDPGRSNGKKTAEMAYLSNYLGQMEKITYPDGEEVHYDYDGGGQIRNVTGVRLGFTFEYVREIGYDEWGQRVYIEYGNNQDEHGRTGSYGPRGVQTWYTYDEDRRWLSEVRTEKGGTVYQNIQYKFDHVGNVLGYKNSAGRYETTQEYEYDNLYQIEGASGASTQYRYAGGSVEDYRANYEQIFKYDAIGNMKTKTSKESKTYGVRNGMPLNYKFEYEYYDGTHRAEKIGDMHYRYDLNGNVTVERSGGHGTVTGTVEGYWREGDLYGADYGFALARPGSQGGKDAYERRYEWDRRNRLIRTKDPQWTVDYRYGYDGQRRLKYAQENRNETAYFNNMWQTSASANNRDWLQSKHIFVGESRIATKSNREVWESGTDKNLGFEINNQYWYHGDHLGSAQVVTERGGSLLERIEYTPYGEIWVEHKYDAAESSLPYRFTGKELDPETNFYYFGARYLDPRTSRWLSVDPAMGDYIPSAPINDEVKKRNGSLPGMGGVFNTVNLHVYHYAGNNPVKYVDPDGRKLEWEQGEGVSDTEYAEAKAMAENIMSSDTEAGRRLREINASEKIVTVRVTSSGGSTADPGKDENGTLGDMIRSINFGSDVFINFNIRGKALLGDNKVQEDPESTLVHEFAHAYLMINGNNYYSRKNRERDAVAVENQYRDKKGLGQPNSYEGDIIIKNVPVYNSSSNSYNLSNSQKKYKLRS